MTNTTKNRKSFYSLLAIFPLIILLLLEMILRLTSFGYEYPLFIKSETIPGYFQPNPNVIKRYFSNPDLAPILSQILSILK